MEKPTTSTCDRPRGTSREPLLEREDERAAIAAGLRTSAHGAGAVLVLEGEPGSGRTRLLDDAAVSAEGAGWQVLRATGAAFEAGFSFGVARQLLEPAVRRLPSATGVNWPTAAEPATVPEVEVLHAIYRLAVEIADQRPLLIVVDDLQWADDGSVRALLHIAQRIGGARMAMLLGVQAGLPEAGSPLSTLVNHPRGERLPVRPLSADGVGRLAGHAVGQPLDAPTVKALHTSTGGNPFLVLELVHAARAVGVPVDAAGVRAIERRVPPVLAGSLLRRVPTPVALRVAQAIAVLGPAAQPRRVARLVGGGVAATLDALAELVAAGLVVDAEPLAFARPLVRGAVSGSLSGAHRDALHHRAAALLEAEGADPGQVAAHLVAAVPAGDAQVARRLLLAARAANDRGAFDEATRLLERALAEPPGASDLGPMLVELGVTAAHREAWSETSTHLRLALDGELPAAERVRAALVLARVGGEHGVLELLGRSVARLDGDQALLVDVERTALGLGAPATAGNAIERARSYASLVGDRPAERAALATLAYASCGLDGTAEGTAATVLRAGRDGRLVAEQGGAAPVVLQAALALAAAEALDDATVIVDALRRDVARDDSPARRSAAARAAAWLALSAGDVGAVVRHGLDGVEALRTLPPSATRATALGSLLHCLVTGLVERGETHRAAQLLDVLAGGEPVASARPWHDASRAAVALATGDAELALRSFAACAAEDATMPGEWRLVRWRLGAARAAAALGRPHEALAWADEQLERARSWGAAGDLGAALHAQALVGDPSVACQRLDAAVELLRASPCRLALAHALVDAGSAHRRAGRRGDARSRLVEGLDGASACGALALRDRAVSELRVAGAKPRRERITGRDALTPSEQRIAGLAAAGRTNREIAQRLFITPKTVELHLTNVYRKLGVSGRREIAPVLDDRESVAVG